MSQTFKHTILVKLNGCAHTPEYDWQYRPLEGDAIYCYKCARTRSFIGYIEQYRVKCSDCRFSRARGVAKLSAEIDASKHHQKHPDHEVKLFLGRKLEHTWRRVADNRNQTVIDLDLDAYPF